MNYRRVRTSASVRLLVLKSLLTSSLVLFATGCGKGSSSDDIDSETVSSTESASDSQTSSGRSTDLGSDATSPLDTTTATAANTDTTTSVDTNTTTSVDTNTTTSVDTGTATSANTATTTPLDSDTSTTTDRDTTIDTIPDSSEWENAPGQPCVMYVHGETGDNLDDGRSWKGAKLTIQAAIDAAEGDGCTFWDVWVAKGTYYPYAPNDRFDATLQLKKNVTVYGGFLGYEIARDQRNFRANETIISGDIGFPEMTEDNACHVVTGTVYMSPDDELEPDTDDGAIDGFTIQDGNADGCGTPNGAGILSAVARNCVITENAASLNGGGAYGSVVENCTFTNNTALDGAGLAVGIATDTRFIGNTATSQGGGASDSTATRCIFQNNTAQTNGGGMNGGNAVDCRFIENQASDGGGASNTQVERAIFTSNSAEGSGGGMSGGSARFSYFIANTAETGAGFSGPTRSERNVFAGNIASVSGGAVSSGKSINDTFLSNTAPEGGAASNSDIARGVLAGNSAETGGGVYESDVAGCTFVDNRATAGGLSAANTDKNIYNSLYEAGTVGDLGQFSMGVTAPADVYAGYPLSEGQWTAATFDSDLYQTTLVAGGGWTPGHLAGQLVKFLDADEWRMIETNTENSLIIKGDVTAIANTGESFEVYDLYLKADSPAIDAGSSEYNKQGDRLGTATVDTYAVSNTGDGPPWVDQGAFEFDDGDRFVDLSFPERAVSCESDAVSAAKVAVNALFDKPEYTGCSETGDVLPESTECVFADSSFRRAFSPIHYCYPGDLTVRRNFDEAAFWQETLSVIGDLYCDDSYSCAGGDGMQVPNCGPVTLPWCVENQCRREKVCACGDGTYYLYQLWCDGVADCANGGDETDCEN